MECVRKIAGLFQEINFKGLLELSPKLFLNKNSLIFVRLNSK